MSKSNSKKYIVLAGGLSAGPLMPLLAVADHWQEQDKNIIPVVFDVRRSVAQKSIKANNYLFERIITGKLRRYFAWQTIFLPFLLLIGFLQSLHKLRKYQPIAILGAGGFVQLPVVIAGWILRIPRFIHQQDVSPTLTNSISALFANKVTVTFEDSIRDFPQGTGLGKKFVTTNKIIWTGNPVRVNLKEEKLSKTELRELFGLNTELPVLLVVGGGTGSVWLNELILKNLPAITKVVQVIHSTGNRNAKPINYDNYHPYQFIDKINEAYEISDIVLSRAGLGALTALAEHKKPAIIVPMPDTHQEQNAELVYNSKSGIVFDQEELSAEILIKVIREVLFNPDEVQKLTTNLHKLFPIHAAHKVYKVITDYLEENE